MKGFIKQIVIFLLLFIGIIFLIEFPTKWVLDKKANFKLNSSSKYIILGNSHPECAFNDSLISNFRNLAKSGEAPFYTYFKTKKILQQNKSIEVVFIEYTNGSISDGVNNSTWGDKYLSHNYPTYSSFMSFYDQLLLLQNNSTGYLNAFSLSIKERIGRLITGDYDFSNKLGGYLYLVRDKTDSLLNYAENAVPNYSPLSSKIDISECNVTYLLKTIQLCRNEGKRVVLVRSPQHQKYEGLKNELKYKEVLDSRFSDTEYLDFLNFPLANSEFGDLDHVNHKGAKIFSNWFSDLLKNGLLERENMSKYVEEAIKAKIKNNMSTPVKDGKLN